MFNRLYRLIAILSLLALFLLIPSAQGRAATSWKGALRDSAGSVLTGATVSLHSTTGSGNYSAQTSATGEFLLNGVAPGNYEVSVAAKGKTWKTTTPAALAAEPDPERAPVYAERPARFQRGVSAPRPSGSGLDSQEGPS